MDKKNRLLCGDALLVLQKLPDNSIDSMVTDPPGGINFMGKEWDKDKGGRDVWIEWLTLVMREALRVLKPGGHALVWSIPRTSHWTATALENAGFEIRDKVAHLFGASTLVNTFLASLDDEQRLVLEQILESQEPGVLAHIFGSGFPKSTNISKQLDKLAGAMPEVVGKHERKGAAYQRYSSYNLDMGNGKTIDNRNTTINAAYIEKGGYDITMPTTLEAQRWDGWGTNLKPAYENWILVRKPLAAQTVAKNVLQYGTGGLNIDATRTSTNRFPSHLLLSHNPDCMPVGTQKVKANGYKDPEKVYEKKGTVYGTYNPVANGTYNVDGAEEIQAYVCTDGCPIAELDRQSGISKSSGGDGYKTHGAGGNGIYGNFAGKDNPKNVGKGDTGGSSRYFTNFAPEDTMPFLYQPKASGREKNAGCEDLPQLPIYTEDTPTPQRDKRQQVYRSNSHPTVKNVTLMRWLIKLITPPDGTVLDCFAGSGSTLVAAIQENKTFIGIEREREYCIIAQARIKHALQAKRAMIDTPVEGKAG